MNQTKTPHPLAAMIKEWAEDTSRVVQVQLEDFGWMDQPNPNFDPNFKWRFADTVPKSPVVRSGLSDKELSILYFEINPADAEWNLGPKVFPTLHHIADAAAQEIVTRIMGLDAGNLTDDEISNLYESSSEQTLRPQDRAIVGAFARYVHLSSVSHFLANLPAALEKNHE